MKKNILAKSLIGLGIMGGAIAAVALTATSCGKPAVDDGGFNIKVGDTVTTFHIQGVKDNANHLHFYFDGGSHVDIYEIALNDGGTICSYYHSDPVMSFWGMVYIDTTDEQSDIGIVDKVAGFAASEDFTNDYITWDQATLTATLATPAIVLEIDHVDHSPLNYLTFN